MFRFAPLFDAINYDWRRTAVLAVLPPKRLLARRTRRLAADGGSFVIRAILKSETLSYSLCRRSTIVPPSHLTSGISEDEGIGDYQRLLGDTNNCPDGPVTRHRWRRF